MQNVQNNSLFGISISDFELISWGYWVILLGIFFGDIGLNYWEYLIRDIGPIYWGFLFDLLG